MQKKSIWKRMKRDWRLYVLLLVPVTLLITFSYLPMIGIVMAFQDFNFRDGFFGSPWVGFKYFELFLQSPMFITLLKNTLALSIYGLIAGFFMPIILAITVNEIKSKLLKKTVQMVTYAPFFISTVVMVGMLMQLLSPRTGLINNIIVFFGGQDYNFMGDSGFFRHIYVWSGIWQSSGYGAIIYIAALAGVSPELYDAAAIDGATRLQKLIYIDIPSIAPTIVITLILSVGGILGVGFEKTYLLQNNLNLTVSEVISTYVYKVGMQQMQYGFSAAVGLFNSVVSFIMVAIVNFIARKVSDTSLW